MTGREEEIRRSKSLHFVGTHDSTVRRLSVPLPGSPQRTVQPEPVQPAHAHEGPSAVAVIAPGAGTGINGAIFQELNQDPRFKVEIVGQSRAPYDRYPPCWPNGAPAPNLESFAASVLSSKVVERSRCLIFGSRGGQVVLPFLWNAQEKGILKVPPAVVMNGGCAMSLPKPVSWPHDAITFVLIGGQDYFRGNLSPEQYVMETRNHVPTSNASTVILYVAEMVHMPQMKLLRSIMQLMLRTLTAWQTSGRPPLEHLRAILSRLSQDGWNGRLLYTSGPGIWEDIKFSRDDVGKLPFTPVSEPCETSEPIMLTRKAELKELWKAAALAAQPGGGAPVPVSKDTRRVTTVIQAAHVAGGGSPVLAPAVQLPPPKAAPMLPIAAVRHEVHEARTPRSHTPKAHESRTPKNLQVPMAWTPGRPCGAELTPISQALGLNCRPGSSPVSPAAPAGFHIGFSPTRQMVPVVQAVFRS